VVWRVERAGMQENPIDAITLEQGSKMCDAPVKCSSKPIEIAFIDVAAEVCLGIHVIGLPQTM